MLNKISQIGLVLHYLICDIKKCRLIGISIEWFMSEEREERGREDQGEDDQ